MVQRKDMQTQTIHDGGSCTPGEGKWKFPQRRYRLKRKKKKHTEAGADKGSKKSDIQYFVRGSYVEAVLPNLSLIFIWSRDGCFHAKYMTAFAVITRLQRNNLWLTLTSQVLNSRASSCQDFHCDFGRNWRYLTTETLICFTIGVPMYLFGAG